MAGFNKNEARRFLGSIDTRAKQFTFQTFQEKGDTNSKVLPRVITASSLNEVWREHEAGAGIYVTVNETDGTGRKRENIVRIRTVFSEDDGGYAGPFPLTPTMTVETSPGHRHHYWVVSDNWPADERGRTDFASVMERMVETYGCDKSAKDISRVLRLPGFLWRKKDKPDNKPFMVRIVEAKGQRYTREQIVTAFPPVVRESKQTEHKERKAQGDEDERIREALNSIDPDPRDLWLQMGMAIKAHMSDAGRPL